MTICLRKLRITYLLFLQRCLQKHHHSLQRLHEMGAGTNDIKLFVRNLRMFIKSLRVCPWQAFPA
jgi:hypothetical protein